MEPQAPSPLFLLSGLGMIAVAVGAVLAWQRCTRRARWCWIAFAYKSAIDAIAAPAPATG